MVSKPRGAVWQITGTTLAAIFAAYSHAKAECLSLTSGPIVMDVSGCAQISPETLFDTNKEKYAWIAGLDASGRKKFFDTYRGLYLKGKVVRSKASTRGLEAEQGALSGDTLAVFLPPAQQQCPAVLGKRVAGNLKEVCCEGGGDVPCLLDTSYLLLQAQALGPASSTAGDQTRQRAKRSKDYQAAERSFRAKRWQEAVKLFEKARVSGELDAQGYYHLGYAFRELDQCGDAVAPLKTLNDQATSKQIWADEEADARRATFLLARCYSKLNQPGPAILLLNSYLLEPEKYRTEIQESLKHKDFGWIHTSREYRDYKIEAEKKLSRRGPSPRK